MDSRRQKATAVCLESRMKRILVENFSVRSNISRSPAFALEKFQIEEDILRFKCCFDCFIRFFLSLTTKVWEVCEILFALKRIVLSTFAYFRSVKMRSRSCLQVLTISDASLRRLVECILIFSKLITNVCQKNTANNTRQNQRRRW